MSKTISAGRRVFISSLLVAALSLCVETAVWGQDGKLARLSPELQRKASGSVEVIIQYKEAPTAVHHKNAAARGGRLLHEFEHVKAAHYLVPAAALAELANDPDVVYISPNRPLKGMLNITAATVHSDIANSQGYTGAGIGVAVIDSGLSTMPEFDSGKPSRIVYQQSFVSQTAPLSLACPGGGAQAGAWYGASLNVQGGVAPYNVSITSGSLPAGLTVDAAGNITGIPASASGPAGPGPAGPGPGSPGPLAPGPAGPAQGFSATVTDAYGNTAAQSCNLNVGPAPPPGPPAPLHLGCAAGGAQATAWYDSLLSPQGGVPPYQFSMSSGMLPAGLSLNAFTGAISGIPTTATQGPPGAFAIKMADSSGRRVSQSCGINVGPAPPNSLAGPADQFGHGSHVAGIVGNNGGGQVYIGIAPNVNLINLRVLDQNGNGTDSSVIQAIDTAISLAATYNIRVMNLSLGRPVFEPAAQDPLCQAVEQAWRAGIVVVVAAGNGGRDNSAGTSGYGTITAPGNDPYVITAGAMKTEGTTTRTDDMIASYSSKGPTAFDHYVKPDIVAPGNLVVSTMPAPMTLSQEYPANRVNGDFFILSGTSMATPVVSGAAALLIQKTPSLTPDQVKARLMKNATKNFPASSVAVDPVTNIAYTSYYDIFTVGAGYIDIEAALADTTVAVGAAPSPAATYSQNTGSVTLQGIGGANVVWGSNAVWGSNVVWGANVVWGSNTTQGLNVVWGSDAVLGASTNDAAEDVSVAINGER